MTKELTAVIYTRGQNHDEQAYKCEAYAKEKEYAIIGLITDLSRIDEYKPDVLIAANVTRISRNQLVFNEIKNTLEAKGITIETATA